MSIFGNTSGAFVEWDEPKSVVGTITDFAMGTDFDGNPAVVVELETDGGDEAAITVAQAQLKAKFAAEFPLNDSLEMLAANYKGDRIAVAYEGKENRPNGRTLKKFVVERKGAEKADAPAGSLL